ncbi:unnamed protein product [Albugo candida]|uniref:USP domain-containing protein n=1 Tax=Albugo candida TaxID=65357 RepID=A0A024FYD3_9STRA|nr:unnamed protein product [Albugo candida]|eukprot:CCI39402.1 unnamed protein product [Albugo candida]
MKRDATVLEDPKNDNESAKTRRKCPYLDTINTQLLDFDFEKICSITLSDQNFVLQNFQRLKKTYHIRLHPRYLILHVKRFTRNNFFVEKNSTIVNFPVKNLEIREYLITNPENPKLEQLNHKSVAEIKELLDQKRISYDALETRSELAIKLQEATVTSTKYNLVANICHDSPLNKGKTTNLNTNPLTEGSYRVHVQNRATEQWYEIQDLHVQETLPQLIGVSETYMLIYERR